MPLADELSRSTLPKQDGAVIAVFEVSRSS